MTCKVCGEVAFKDQFDAIMGSRQSQIGAAEINPTAGAEMKSTSFATKSENLRCRENDLALVIQDTANCVSNLGRVVIVHGPVIRSFNSFGMLTWLIKPLHSVPWAVENHRHGIKMEMLVDWVDKIEHPDAWLVPLRTDLMEILTSSSLVKSDFDMSNSEWIDFFTKHVQEVDLAMATDSLNRLLKYLPTSSTPASPQSL